MSLPTDASAETLNNAGERTLSKFVDRHHFQRLKVGEGGYFSANLFHDDDNQYWVSLFDEYQAVQVWSDDGFAMFGGCVIDRVDDGYWITISETFCNNTVVEHAPPHKLALVGAVPVPRIGCAFFIPLRWELLPSVQTNLRSLQEVSRALADFNQRYKTRFEIDIMGGQLNRLLSYII